MKRVNGMWYFKLNGKWRNSGYSDISDAIDAWLVFLY